MATSYKVLGQSNPAATTATTLYTVPAATQAVISTLVVCNQASTAATFRLAVRVGGAALAAGLTTEAVAAENLARYGITKQQAEQGYQAIGGMLPRASQLADIYKQDPYTQSVAEAEVFGTGGAVSAAEKRKKLTALETAKFSGSSGAASNALSRDRAMSQMSYRDPGAGAF
jgi:hypothetical protein